MTFDFKRVVLGVVSLPLVIILLPAVLVVQAVSDFVKAVRAKGLLSWPSLAFVGEILVTVGVILPLWLGTYYVAGRYLARTYGFVAEEVPISGTGSMYPTFPKGVGKTPQELSKQIVGLPGMFPYPSGIPIWGRRFFNYTIGQGDIVEFENGKTDEITRRDEGEATGFVKRVIALPGETIEIRDGLVYIDGKPISEPYIARARSSFGGDFLGECQKLTIPVGKLFVMGDNRKGSLDSRYELGLISDNDIHFVIPWKNQKGVLDNNFRDTSSDLSESAKIKLDRGLYLERLNAQRKAAGVTPLVYQSKLEASATIRARVMMQFDDFSFEASRSGETMEKAMAQAGYSNVVWGETPTQGYFDANELIDNQFAFAKAKSFLLDKDYQDIGIAEVEGTINGCPAQVIVQHLAGFKPPDYSKAMVNSWQQALARLEQIQPGWASLKTFPSFYSAHQQEVDRINEIIGTRVSNINAIVTTMQANQWLTKAEINYSNQDAALAREQEELATKLNGQ